MAKWETYYKDPFYSRWQTAVNRYLRKNSPVYINQDGRTLTMAKEWQPPDRKGFYAFRAWVLAELAKHPEIPVNEFRVLKRDKNGDFGPDNCYLYQYGTGKRARTEAEKAKPRKPPAEKRVEKTDDDYRPTYPSPDIVRVSGVSMLEQMFFK